MTVIIETENNLSTRQKLKRSSWTFYVISFGIVLPTITLIVELVWAWCAQVFFDPVPTMFHAAMIAMVPIANLMALLLIRYGRYQACSGRILFINGIAIGICAFYTILFIPLMPMAAVALIWLIGLLPLAPVLSLIAAIMCRRAIPRPAITDPIKPLTIRSAGARFNVANWGIAAALVVIVAAELPLAITEIGLRMATSQDSKEQLRGVRLLRGFADHDRLLSYSYSRRGRASDMISFVLNWDKKSISVDDARKVYYRVTGQVFNDVEPVSMRRQGLWENGGWFDFDIDQGGNRVGKQLAGVRLSSSVIDGSIDAAAAVAYLEWTFEFANQSYSLAEARAQISLPPGAVVSRVTLWIDGEEREAAFAGRGQARKAYRQVVQRQRDPILVTTAGADTVLVQLYPIPVGGRMKARIGITAPLVLRNTTQAVLRLPHFKQKNFNIEADFEHSLWVESGQPMINKPAHLIFESGNSGASTLRGKLQNDALKSPRNNILISRESQASRSYAINNRAGARHAVMQRIVKQDASINKLVIVVDGSKSMQKYIGQVADVISGLSEHMEISVIVAGDQIKDLKPGIYDDRKALHQRFAGLLRDFDFDGGVDNTGALETAWSLAATHRKAAVLWIHGPQPIILKTAHNLRQNWRRRPDGPRLYDFPVTSQVNRVGEALDDVMQFKLLPRIGSLKEDLAYQFELWGGTRQQLVANRQAISSETQILQSTKTSDHLVRLWANDRIQALIAESSSESTEQATEMAAHYQLVTPVSGAVVLENQQQYAENGLQPVKAGTVPTIPEPETWLLIIATLLILSWVVYRRQGYLNDRNFLA
jgi:hypothetical protein